jgi:hypothetical protein
MTLPARPTRRVRGLFAAAMAAAVVTLAACGGAEPPAAEPTPLPPAEGGPIDLVGMWRVSDADGEAADTWLRLDAGELQLWRGCGPIMGSWDAGERTFVASGWGASGSCAQGSVPDIPWLASTMSYQRVGETWELRDADGAVTATLRIDGGPEPIETVTENYTRPPRITDRTREHFAETPALPESLTAPDERALEGRWVPASGADAFVEFVGDGTWTGSDGCNGGSGGWVIADGGEFVASSGPSTLIGCDGAPVPAWVATARLVGLEGSALVLLDRAGAELGRLTRG